jgi:hypothetical protein
MNKNRIEENKRRLFLPLALLYLFWIESVATTFYTG